MMKIIMVNIMASSPEDFINEFFQGIEASGQMRSNRVNIMRHHLKMTSSKRAWAGAARPGAPRTTASVWAACPASPQAETGRATRSRHGEDHHGQDHGIVS